MSVLAEKKNVKKHRKVLRKKGMFGIVLITVIWGLIPAGEVKASKGSGREVYYYTHCHEEECYATILKAEGEETKERRITTCNLNASCIVAVVEVVKKKENPIGEEVILEAEFTYGSGSLLWEKQDGETETEALHEKHPEEDGYRMEAAALTVDKNGEYLLHIFFADGATMRQAEECIVVREILHLPGHDDGEAVHIEETSGEGAVGNAEENSGEESTGNEEENSGEESTGNEEENFGEREEKMKLAGLVLVVTGIFFGQGWGTLCFVSESGRERCIGKVFLRPGTGNWRIRIYTDALQFVTTRQMVLYPPWWFVFLFAYRKMRIEMPGGDTEVFIEQRMTFSLRE